MKQLAIFTLISTILSACVIPVESTPSVNTGSVFVPVLVQDNQNNVYVCQIKAFTETFRSENTNRGRARLDVKKQCTAKYHDMFCSDEEIKCTEY